SPPRPAGPWTAGPAPSRRPICWTRRKRPAARARPSTRPAPCWPCCPAPPARREPATAPPRPSRRRPPEAAAGTGKLDEALQTLASLRAAWPERPGLAERTARAESARKEDQRLESVLAEAARDGHADRPVAGLDLL